MKRRALIGLVLLVALALVLPSSAQAFTWKKAGGDPLVRGGIKSAAKFKSLMLSNARVRRAVRTVLARDGYGGWVFQSAVDNVAAGGNIHSSSLSPGAYIGVMAYHPTGSVKYASRTTWVGRGRLPYFYVIASRTIPDPTTGGTIEQRVLVALAKTCANAFAIRLPDIPTGVLPPETFNLSVEKRQDSIVGTQLAGFEITGTVTDPSGLVTPIDVFTTTGTVNIGSFPAGSTYNLSEVTSSTWTVIVGTLTGTTPAADSVLTFINSMILPPEKFPLCVEKRQDSLEGTRLAGWEITGTVVDPDGTTHTIDVTTNNDTCTPLGDFPAGATYTLSEETPDGWMPIDPISGTTSGVMPAAPLTVTFVNSITYPLCVEKRQDSLEGTRLAGWEILGTVTDPTGVMHSIDVTTSADDCVLVGNFPAGSTYMLSEVGIDGWTPVDPLSGTLMGTMPATSTVLTFINSMVAPPEKFPLCVEKRQDSLEGTRLAGWEITGTVTDPDGTTHTIDVTTTDDACTPLGDFAAGATFTLSETLKDGWMVVTPSNGTTSGVMPGEPLTIVFVNTQQETHECMFLTKGFWQGPNGMAILENHWDWVAYANTLAPYSGDPFNNLDEVGDYLVAPNAGGDPKIQLGQQLLAFIFNAKDCGATFIIGPDGQVHKIQDLIDDAAAAWVTGGDTARDWATLIETYNSDQTWTVF